MERAKQRYSQPSPASPVRVTNYRTINGFGISPTGAASPTIGVLTAGGRPTYGEEKKRLAAQRLVTHHGFGVSEEALRRPPLRTSVVGLRLSDSSPRASASLSVREPTKPSPALDPKALLRNKLVAKKAKQEAEAAAAAAAVAPSSSAKSPTG